MSSSHISCKCLFLGFIFVVFASCSSLSSANDFSPPSGDIVLTITGQIESFNNGETLELDMAMLEKFPQISFSTDTPWTEQKTKWTGVRLNQLFASLGAKSVKFSGVALDDYVVKFEGIDVEKYPVIIAYKKDDEYMSTRDLGPLWLMFPFDDYPELDTQSNRVLCIWQLVQIDVF